MPRSTSRTPRKTPVSRTKKATAPAAASPASKRRWDLTAAPAFAIGFVAGSILMAPVLASTLVALPDENVQVQQRTGSSASFSSQPSSPPLLPAKPFVKSQLRVTSLLQSEDGGHPRRVQVVIRSDADWEDLRQLMAKYDTSLAARPPVNFAYNAVLVMFGGRETRKGGSVTITHVVQTGSQARSTVKIIRPGEGCNELPEPVSPFHMVITPVLPQDVRFLVEEEMRDCAP